MKNQKGFTLIEFVVVLAILAITTAYAYPRLAGYISLNRQTYRSNQEYLVNKALTQYYALTGTYYRTTDDYNIDDQIDPGDINTMITALNSKTGSLLDSGDYVYFKTDGSAKLIISIRLENIT